MDQTEIFRADSLKDLNRQINELRDAIVRLKSAGQDYSKEAQQLQAAERLKAETMAMSKREATALEGSYDALSKKMKELKREYHSTADAMKRAELAPQIRDLNDQLKAMDADVGTFTRNVGNYASAFGQVKQVGGDMINGFRSLTGILGLTTVQQDKLNDSEKAFATVLGIVQGAKGIAGFISGLKSYITTAQSAKKAQEALNTATQAGTAATEAGGKAVAEAGSTVTKAIPWLLAIGAAIALVAYYWDEVSSAISRWLGWEKQSKEETEKLTKANDKLNEKFEEQNHQLDNQAKLMKAQGKSQKEVLESKLKLIEAQKKDTEATIANVEARIAEIKTHSWLQRLINGENKERKELEAQLDELAKTMKKLNQTTVDINVDIQVEDIEAGKAGAQKAKERYASIVKAAEEAQKELEKMNTKLLTPLEQIEKEYEIILEKVADYSKAWKEGLEAEYKAGKVTEAEYLKQSDFIGKRTLTVHNAVIKERSDKEREYYKGIFDLAYKNYTEIQRLNKDFTERQKSLYEGLVSEITGFATDRNEYENRLSEDRIARTKADAQKILGILRDMEGISKQEYEDFVKAVTEDGTVSIKKVYNLYTEMLNSDENNPFKFVEPFKTALQQLVPLMEQLETQTNDSLKSFVTGTMAEIEEAIGRENYGILPALFEKLFSNPPVNASDELKGAVQNYMRMIYKEVEDAIIENETMGMGDKLSLLDILFPEDTEEKSKAKLRIINDTVTKYRDITVDCLNDVYNAWNNVIQAVDASIDRQLKEGRISQQEADRKKKQNEKAFKALKAFQITTAVINGLAASVQALIDPSVPNFYVRLANSISAAAMATAQVAAISAQNYNGETSSSGSVSAPTLVDRTPYTATVGLNPQDTANAMAQNPIRAFVVDSDLKEGLDKYDERIADTSF